MNLYDTSCTWLRSEDMPIIRGMHLYVRFLIESWSNKRQVLEVHPESNVFDMHLNLASSSRQSMV